MEKGSWIWVYLEHDQDWKCGKIVDVDVVNFRIHCQVGYTIEDAIRDNSGNHKPDLSVDEQELGTGNHRIVIPFCDQLARLAYCNPLKILKQGLSDLSKLAHLHEPAILHALSTRFQRQEIYTSTGNVLLAMNPYERLPHLYSRNVLRRYMNEGHAGNVPPHPFHIADQAYRAILDPCPLLKLSKGYSDCLNAKPSCPPLQRQNQSILISGESGAGKTETTKILLEYLTQVASKVQSNSVERILQSHPVLEAFGNAQTIRNDNSSRFGKFLQVRFNGPDLASVFIQTFLLERVRVVSQSPRERNYHVFYQLLAGHDVEDDDLGLSRDPRAYFYLSQGRGSPRGDSPENLLEKNFERTKDAMMTIGLVRAELAGIWKLLAGILHLGNLEFDHPKLDESSTAGSEVACGVTRETQASLEHASQVLGISSQELHTALCQRSIQAGLESIQIGLSFAEAQSCRDGWAKTIYAQVFQYLVQRINEELETTPTANTTPRQSLRWIGILDIFGFEIMDINSFEQLCINYANEKLQQVFQRAVFSFEEQEYQAEGLEWEVDDVPEQSTLCLEAMEEPHQGLFALLDEQSRLKTGSDAKFIHSLYEHMVRKKSQSVFSASSGEKARAQFSIHHYVKPVSYDVTGFRTKNNDQMQAEGMLKSLKNSTDLAIQRIMSTSAVKEGKPTHETSKSKLRKRAASFLNAATISGQFKDQLQSLVGQIETTVPHFIRCLKPNDEAQPKVVTRTRVLKQLRSSGILQVVQISRSGCPIRLSHDDFERRYGRLAMKESNAKSIHGLVAALLMSDPKFVPASMKVGKTKIFLSNVAHGTLESSRVRLDVTAAIRIQHIFRQRRAKLRHFVRKIETCYGLYRFNQRKHKSALVLQCASRQYLAKHKLEQLRFLQRQEQVVKIQSLVRRYLSRQGVQKLRRKHVVVIQNAVRQYLARQQYEKLLYERQGKLEHDQALVIQCRIRQHFAQEQVKRRRLLERSKSQEDEERDAIVVIQRSVRHYLAKRKRRDMIREQEERVKIQAYARQFKERVALRRRVKEKHRRVIQIQSLGRQYLAKVEARRRRRQQPKARQEEERENVVTHESDRVYQLFRDHCAQTIQCLARQYLARLQGLSRARGKVQPQSQSQKPEPRKKHQALPVADLIKHPFDQRPSSSATTKSSSTDSLLCPDTTTYSGDSYELMWHSGILGLFFECTKTSYPVVKSISPFSALENVSNIRPGDLLIAVGNVSLTQETTKGLNQVTDIFASMAKPVALRLIRKSSSSSSNEQRPIPRFSKLDSVFDGDGYEVLWTKGTSLGLGFHYRPDTNQAHVEKLQAGNQNLPGMHYVQVDDILTHINEYHTNGKPFEQVLHTLEYGHRPAVLRFQRSLEHIPPPEEEDWIGPEEPDKDRLIHVCWNDAMSTLGIVVKQSPKSHYPIVRRVKHERVMKGNVREGDVLVSINDENINAMGFQAALKILQKMPKPMLLIFYRPMNTSVNLCEHI